MTRSLETDAAAGAADEPASATVLAPVVDPSREAQTFFSAVQEAPHGYDLWHVLRVLDAMHPERPPLGRAQRPRDEPLRIGQEPSLVFAPTQITRVDTNAPNGRPRMSILGFGLFGPNGPLPLHLTDYARERIRVHGDATLVHFCDLFHHRFTLFFYRAWADAQATVSLDRGAHPGAGHDGDSFSRYIASLIHLGDPTLRNRDAVPDHAKFFGAGHLVRETRNAEGLQRLLQLFFNVPVGIEQWVSHWLTLLPEQRTRLGGGRPADQLGVGAVAGASVPDVQSRFRVRMGALSRAEYDQHLPGGRFFMQVLGWLRNYIGFELQWDLRLVLKREEVPSAALGGMTRLGWTSWLGTRTRQDDADDLVLDHETILARPSAKAAAYA
ncbi:MAG: type VI secretion system baseplate subunit TssG [Pseudomonadota bacterium]|nr:type VI secretion system baseplate subunit TssG [Pseudomonadota bacterium]